MSEIPKFDISQHVSMLFGSILVVHDWPETENLNSALAEILRQEKTTGGHGMKRSNAGGWQSSGNLLDQKAPAIQGLKQRIETLVFNLTDQIIRDDGKQRSFNLITDAWGNINTNGDYNVVHTHPNCMWSGCYYIDSGQPDIRIKQNGLLELIDPRDAANYIQIKNTILDARQFIENLPGRMVLWPSWMKHMVHPYTGEGERISIAFNVNVIEAPPS